MTSVVCLKWVDRRPEFDSRGQPAPLDERFAGLSSADEAALECALCDGDEVVAVSVGPAGTDQVLRQAAAVGATRLVRVDAPLGLASDLVADALAQAISGLTPAVQRIWFGDHSLDRGTGSVPAFVAHRLGLPQLLGLVAVERRNDGSGLRGVRRLDGGRREIVDADGPVVCSVEGATARLRRAALTAVLAAGHQPIEVLPGPAVADAEPPLLRPYRPRARVLDGPLGEQALDRVRALLSAGAVAPAHGDPIELAPADAARRILDALLDWGYLAGEQG